MSSKGKFIQFLDQCLPLGTENQNAWQNWKCRFTETLSGRNPVLFWYLSSGTDFFPVRHFHLKTHTDAFFYTDQAPFGLDIISRLHSGNPDKSAEKWEKQGLELKTAFMISHPNVANPIAFFLLTNKNDRQEKTIPLFFLHSANIAVLIYFVYQNLTFKYLCSVADGCRTLSPDERNICPLSMYGFYSKVLEGYWISDHLPEAVKDIFSETEVIEGWGRYNLEEKTAIYQINRMDE